MVEKNSTRKSEQLNSEPHKASPLEYARGRPTKYQAEWMLPKIIELMGQGATKIEICAEFGVCRDVLYDWMKRHKELSDAMKIGVVLQQAWWEREGRLNISNNKFNSPLWSKMISNMFREDWAEKKEKEQIDIQTILNALNLELLKDSEIASLTRILSSCINEKKTSD